MKNIKNKAFTLVELLVVITILAIISVVAYQNFGWAVDKAVSGRKISDVSTIETSLQQYKADKNYYPPTDLYDAVNNMWWYNSWTSATPSNTIRVTYSGQEISSIILSNWWWKVYWTWTWSTKQIWAKWTISINNLWKKYLSKDLYDPELWDIKVWTTKMIDNWLWRYIYSTYKKSKSAWDWSKNYNWINYNIAFTIKEKWWDKYIAKIVGDYDKESCYLDKDKCPNTLIWNWNGSVLQDWETENNDSNLPNYWVPYAVTDFAE